MRRQQQVKTRTATRTTRCRSRTSPPAPRHRLEWKTPFKNWRGWRSSTKSTSAGRSRNCSSLRRLRSRSISGGRRAPQSATILGRDAAELRVLLNVLRERGGRRSDRVGSVPVEVGGPAVSVSTLLDATSFGDASHASVGQEKDDLLACFPSAAAVRLCDRIWPAICCLSLPAGRRFLNEFRPAV
jgi:hypothetical protein